jgi:hypothetical protein
MSENIITDCFDQAVIDFIRNTACECGCGMCEKPTMIHSFLMTDDTASLVLNSLSSKVPIGCTDWAIHEPNYGNYLWASGKLRSRNFYNSDCITPTPDFHTSMKGYSFYLEVWVWCNVENRCL